MYGEGKCKVHGDENDMPRRVECACLSESGEDGDKTQSEAVQGGFKRPQAGPRHQFTKREKHGMKCLL